MSPTPGYPPQMPLNDPFLAPDYGPPRRTSGFAITSLILGILGLPTCCLPLFSGLSLIFGIVALPAIRRNEASGKGLAITGIVLGGIGLLVGIGFWLMAILSPKPALLAGTTVSEAQKGELQKAAILKADENVEWLYVVRPDQITTQGVLLTDRRLVTFTAGRTDRACALERVTRIDRKTNEWQAFALEAYVLTLDDGSKIEFYLMGGLSANRKAFETTLRQRVAGLRGEPASTGPSDEGKQDKSRPNRGGTDAAPAGPTRPATDRENNLETRAP